ncbi:MAG: hypothetical protein AAGG45_04030, partial [Pseudomonadota bacterium]
VGRNFGDRLVFSSLRRPHPFTGVKLWISPPRREYQRCSIRVRPEASGPAFAGIGGDWGTGRIWGIDWISGLQSTLSTA